MSAGASQMVGELAPAWRARAEQLRPYAAAAARAFEEAASELETALAAAENDALNLTEASRESGYSADYLGRLIRAGKIPNVGREHAPRIRRANLPKKASASASGGASFGVISRDAMRTRIRR